MRRHLAFASSLLYLLAALGAANAAGRPLPEAAFQPDRSVLAADSEAQWVTFELTPGNQIRFAMTIDGRTATGILDTGVSNSVLSARWALAAGIRPRGVQTAEAVAGSVTFGWAEGRAITIGGMTRSGGRMAVVTLPDDATGGSTPVDALIGRDLIARYALDIDFANRRFRLLPSGRLPFVGDAAPLAISPRQQVYVTDLTIGGRRLKPVIVDTGDGATVTLSTEAWRSLGVALPASTTTISYSVAGPVLTELTELPAVSIGATRLRGAETRIEPQGGFSARLGVSGRIGMGFLQRYRVLLDPLAGRMVLAANPDADKPPIKSTSGLLFTMAGDRLRVIHVMRGGPAAGGAWRVGDQICAIDGVRIAADYPRTALANWPIGVPGRMVELGLCGGSSRSLTLERFY
ncbi:aspartyl protease family protein [uncultured Sphingomonas sp.]|uniref:aspartyl protease family protein n=1 Tax=uncultured Sphingomonas sp. TaxID=158754 RepID=UPI0035CBE94E